METTDKLLGLLMTGLRNNIVLACQLAQGMDDPAQVQHKVFYSFIHDLFNSFIDEASSLSYDTIDGGVEGITNDMIIYREYIHDVAGLDHYIFNVTLIGVELCTTVVLDNGYIIAIHPKRIEMPATNSDYRVTKFGEYSREWMTRIINPPTVTFP